MTAEGSPHRVRTTEGARFFGAPIGTIIGNRFDPNATQVDRAVTMTRLVSLQRQFLTAKLTGNVGQMQNLQEEFSAAVKEYAATNGQLTDVLNTLVASRGRADQAIDAETPGQAAPADAGPAPAAGAAADGAASA